MYSIGEISKIVNVSIDALRYYDEIGLLKPVHIDQSSRYRYYSETQITELLFIMELKQYGFSLDAIRELLPSRDAERLREALVLKLGQLQSDFQMMERTIKSLKRKINVLEGAEGKVSEKSVLIVDDSVFMRSTLRQILGKHGFTVRGEAKDGLEAVSRYRELQPDLVVMDIFMPELDGIKATEKIMELDNTARIVMLSAKAFPDQVLESVRAGALDFVVKPFQEENLIEAISRVVAEIPAYKLDAVNKLLENKRYVERSAEDKAMTQMQINELLGELH